MNYEFQSNANRNGLKIQGELYFGGGRKTLAGDDDSAGDVIDLSADRELLIILKMESGFIVIPVSIWGEDAGENASESQISDGYRAGISHGGKRHRRLGRLSESEKSENRN